MAEDKFTAQDITHIQFWRWTVLETETKAEAITHLYVPTDAPQEDHDRADELLCIIRPAIQEAADRGWYFETFYKMSTPLEQLNEEWQVVMKQEEG